MVKSCNKKIHWYLSIPFFTYHIRALIKSFYSKLPDIWNRQLGRHLLPSKSWLKSRTCNRWGPLSKPVEAAPQKWLNRCNDWCLKLAGYCGWYSVIFLSCKANTKVQLKQGAQPPCLSNGGSQPKWLRQSPWGLKVNRSNPFWLLLPDIHPTKVLFVKDKLPDGFVFSLDAMAPNLNMSRPTSQDMKPVIKQSCPATRHESAWGGGGIAPTHSRPRP
jgi:hypothetical protein